MPSGPEHEREQRRMMRLNRRAHQVGAELERLVLAALKYSQDSDRIDVFRAAVAEALPRAMAMVEADIENGVEQGLDV